MKAIVKEAAKYAGISTGIALGIFCFVGMLFDLYYGGNFSLSGYQFTKMVIGCVLVGWGFGVPAAASHARSPRWVRRSARRWLRYTPRRCGQAA